MSKIIIWIISNTDFISHYPTEYSIHKGVWSLFGNHHSNRPFIYRVVSGKKITVIAIRSSIEPEKSPITGTLKVREEGTLQQGGTYKLSSTLNPIVEKAINGKGTRVPLANSVDIETWAVSKLEANGFTVLKTSNDKPAIICTPPTRKYMNGRGNFYIVTSNIQTVVKVSDVRKASEAFLKGVGKEKSFGCGMLNLVPMSSTDFISEDEEEND